MDGYCVPARRGTSRLEAKGSIFYGRADHVESEEEVRALLADAHAAHPEATHHAFAYRLGAQGEVARWSDDGEPGGTAGRPIMETLMHNHLVYAAVIVSRRFGGTLLGAGGLVRAYGGAAAEAVRAAGVATLQPHVRLRITLDYALLGALQQEIGRAGLRPPQEEFAAAVTLTLVVPSEQVEVFQERVRDLAAGRVQIASLDTLYLPV